MDLRKYRDIPYETRDYCMICERKIEYPVIDMPEFPLTEIYLDRKIEEKLGYLDQSFHFCSHCGHGQIANVIDVKLQYDASYFSGLRGAYPAVKLLNISLIFSAKFPEVEHFGLSSR